MLYVKSIGGKWLLLELPAAVVPGGGGQKPSNVMAFSR